MSTPKRTKTASKPKILIWGAGSQARIIIEMIRESRIGTPVALFDAHVSKPAFDTDIPFTRDATSLKKKIKAATHYVTCIGGEHGYARVRTSMFLEECGLKPLSLIHAKSFIEPSATLGAGCQVMPCAVVHKFAHIGNHLILNTNATVDHECTIRHGVHIMGGAALAGRVSVGDYATIGTNATILPDITIGEGAYVGAGAVVTRNVAPYTIVAGVPAKKLRAHKLKFLDEALLKSIV